MGDPKVEQDAIAIMQMLVGKAGLRAGDTMANGLILSAVKEMGLEGLRRDEALTFAGDKAWLESRDGSSRSGGLCLRAPEARSAMKQRGGASVCKGKEGWMRANHG
jgi:hypothetical protein